MRIKFSWSSVWPIKNGSETLTHSSHWEVRFLSFHLNLGGLCACSDLKVTIVPASKLRPEETGSCDILSWTLILDMLSWHVKKVQLPCRRDLIERLETVPAKMPGMSEAILDSRTTLDTNWILPTDPCWCMYIRRIFQLSPAQIMPNHERWQVLVGGYLTY